MYVDSVKCTPQQCTKDNHPATRANEPRCHDDQSDTVNEPDSRALRALVASISQEVTTNETGEMYSLPAFLAVQEPNFMWVGWMVCPSWVRLTLHTQKSSIGIGSV